MIKIYVFALVVYTLVGCSSKTVQLSEEESKIKVIFETDMGNDVDDALALDMLYKYMDAGEIDLLSIMTNKESKYSSEFIDILNTWYGYPDIPVGIVHNGADCENDATNFAKSVCFMKNNDGEFAFKRSWNNYTKLPEAHVLYRKILAQQPDSSVTIISVGFSTNLARLLDTPGDDISPLSGKELVARKVKLLCTMAGCFNSNDHIEYNVVKDITSAKKVFGEWPTPLVTSPFEVGVAIKYPASSIENDFNWTALHPMVEAYKSYLEMPYDRPTWDLTSVLYSVEGDSYFSISTAGFITVTDEGRTIYAPDLSGNRYYLKVDSIQSENIKNRFIQLITKQPEHLSNQ